MRQPNDILVVRNDRLGDALLALPTIPSLKKIYPDSPVHFWASPAVAPLIRFVDGVDRVIVGNDRKAPKALRQLSSLPIRIAYCLRPTFNNAWILKRSGIPKRIGTSRRWYSFLFTHRIRLQRSGINRHETDLNLDLINEGENRDVAPFPTISIPDAEIEAVRRLLEQSGIDREKPLVVIHPGSGGSAREWSAEYYRTLAESLAEQVHAEIIVTGVEGEMEKCRKVAGDKYLNLCGKTSLIQLSALVLQSELLVTNSTGPLHLTIALGKKGLGIYPPVKDCLPSRWGPYGHPDWALMPDLPLCSSCKPGEISSCACLEKLLPERVFEKARELLQKSTNG